MNMAKSRCEGWRRKGGMFTFGPVHWSQCENDAVVTLTVRQDGVKRKPLPACKKCWQECIGTKGIRVIEAIPFTAS